MAEQEGQKPRCLQEKATRYSFPQASHRTRAKPLSGRPQSKTELGMEAIWKIQVVDFPAFILVDDKGNDFFQQIACAG